MKKFIIPIILILGLLGGGCGKLIQKTWPFPYSRLISREQIESNNGIKYEMDSFIPSWRDHDKRHPDFLAARYGYKSIFQEGKPVYLIIFADEGNEHHPYLKILGIVKHTGRDFDLKLDNSNIQSLNETGKCEGLLKAKGEIIIEKELKMYFRHEIKKFKLIDLLSVTFEDDGEIITIELKNIDYQLKRGIHFGWGY